MSDGRTVRWLLTAALAGGAVLSGCAEPNFGSDDLATRSDSKTADRSDDDGEEPGDIVLGAPAQGTELESKPPEQRCTDECTAGEKRCGATSLAGTEICQTGEGGCRTWAPGPDCDASSSCDKTKNDGTCKAGCENDAGCSAANAGVARCTEDGTTELTCTQVGACYVFRTTRSNIPQDCISAAYCGAASGRRINCIASAAGACTQHIAQYNDCPTGTTCTGAGACTTTTTNPPPPPPPPTGGCYSNTLKKQMPEGACVFSAGDGVTQQCHNGLWYRGVSNNVGPYGACK
jgi:hypothetical protein